MTSLIKRGGKLVKVGNALSTNEECCCGVCATCCPVVCDYLDALFEVISCPGFPTDCSGLDGQIITMPRATQGDIQTIRQCRPESSTSSVTVDVFTNQVWQGELAVSATETWRLTTWCDESEAAGGSCNYFLFWEVFTSGGCEYNCEMN